NPLLFDGAGGTNPVEEYRTYRASATGGLYNAKIYLEDQLIDQFGFGIKKNPAGIRNFIMYARRNFPVMPRQVFLIGRGVHYRDQRNNESSASATRKANLEKLNLVPTFGHPASDMLLVSDLSTSTPLMPIGRLTAITPAEVSTYLKKVKEYEQAQQTLSPSVQDKRWMKNVAHIIGAGEGVLDDILFQYMEGYRLKAQDSLFGGKVTTFRKRSANAVEQLNDADLTRLINNGVSLLTYYGHSSPTTLEFNLDDPGNYNNQGKYPMFLALGCNAGNTFDYNEGRFSARSYLSDKYVLAPDRGSINFVASSHFGIVHYLDIWNTRAYANFSGPLYGRSIGEVIRKTVADMFSLNADDFFARCNAEETILNGDPAVTLNQQSKPDYVINGDMVSVSPNVVSVADQTFKVKINLLNLGKVTNKRIVVETKRQFPNQQIELIRRDTIRGVRYSDSLIFSVPIDPLRDKGANRILVTVDTDNAVDELFETNNSASRDFAIFEEEARPVYPQPFAIVNQAGISLKVSTANPFGDLKQYRMEIDTTETFNSSFKSSTTISSRGGLLEFTPGITYTAGTVYYWRVGPVTQGGSVVNWNMSSFVYLPGHDIGFNQSHVDQHTKSEFHGIKIDSAAGALSFKEAQHEIFIRNGVFPATSNQNSFYYVYINGQPVLGPGCGYDELIFNVLDAKTLKPVANQYANGSGQYNSNPSCAADRKYNFMFTVTQATGRKNAMDFLAQVPSGSYVIVRNNGSPSVNTYPDVWMSDTTLYGSGNSLYHRLVGQGFANLDSFDRPRAWAFIFKKDDQSAFAHNSAFSQDIYDGLTLKVNGTGLDSSGHVVSPVFGPAKQWKSMFWSGASEESPSTDHAVIGLLGIRKNGTVDTLFKNINVLTQQTFDVSSINAVVHPHVQLLFESKDGTNYTPYQLRNWRISYLPVPEGALAPNVHLSVKDTVDVGEPLNFSIAFKNISEAAFDSLKVNMVITDRNNMQHILPVSRFKPLAINDTVHVRYNIDTRNLVGSNTLFLNVNPDGDQPEHFLFNNFGYRNFYVRGDTLNPLMDVTFDNVHILNNDIVSSRPDILIKLKDEAKWMTLTDTSIASVQVRFPSGQLRTYHFNSDTLTFTAATGAPNADNTASIRLKPNFQKDGNYELIVSAKDMSNNAAGALSYRVGFQVINKPMISNMLNYPNPFTTSTAFVFTLTGSEVPQNLRIQILTVTGKIVREITKQELGPLRIGRNITDFKWDGTDQYGQKLANGVYLYRVITNQHGKSLDKFKPSGDETDKYFNNGYGKMYLMR
ncbi:MAG TPA: C25 family cysteine peptidase, partial [Flavisolibacter sp.]|nr:C25 family cysteine peptidase [Flavisolibacter sp.]